MQLACKKQLYLLYLQKAIWVIDKVKDSSRLSDNSSDQVIAVWKSGNWKGYRRNENEHFQVDSSSTL